MYMRKVLPSDLTNTIEQLIVYVHWNEEHFTYIYVYHRLYQCIWGWQHLQKSSPKCHFAYIFAIFISLWGSTHDFADCWSAHRSPAARDSFKRVQDRCQAGWRQPGAPIHIKKPDYAGAHFASISRKRQ